MQHIHGASRIICTRLEDTSSLLLDPLLYPLLEWYFDCEDHCCFFRSSCPLLPEAYRSRVCAYRAERCTMFGPDEASGNSIAYLWALYSVLAGRASKISALLPLGTAARNLNLSSYFRAVGEYEKRLRHFQQQVDLFESEATRNTTPQVYRSLWYFDIVLQSAYAHLQNFVRPSISLFQGHPHLARPENSYLDGIRWTVSKIQLYFGLDSVIPCLLPITVAALACADPWVQDWLTEYETYKPDLVNPYKRRLYSASTSPHLTANPIPDSESHPFSNRSANMPV